MKKITVLLLSLIILTSLFVRFYKLGQVPLSLYWDEVAMLVDVRSILSTGSDLHGRPWFQVIFPSYGDFKLPLLIWLATFSSAIFGASNFSLRLVSALAGLGTAIIAGLFTQTVFKQHSQKNDWQGGLPPQFFTLLVVLIIPWSLTFSRTAFEGHIAQFLVAVSLYLYVRFSNRWLSPGLAAVFGALATYGYYSVRFVWPIVLVAAWFLLKVKKREIFPLQFKRMFDSVVILGFPLLVYVLLLIPLLVSPLYRDSTQFRLGTASILKNEEQILQQNIYRELAGNSFLDRLLFHRYSLTMRELALNYHDHLNLNFLFFQGDPNLRHSPGNYGLFYGWMLPLFILGWWTIFNRRWQVGLFLLIWWIFALLPAAVPLNTPHALRSINALVPLSIVIGMGLFQTWTWLDQKLARAETLKSALILLSLVSIQLSLLFFSFHYFTVYKNVSAPDWQTGYQQLAEATFKHRNAQEPVYFAPFDDKFYLWIMAYGPYNGYHYQAWTSRNYLFENFDGITFNQLPTFDTVQSRLLVGATSAQMNEYLKPGSTDPSIKIELLETITSSPNQHTFVLYALQRQ